MSALLTRVGRPADLADPMIVFKVSKLTARMTSMQKLFRVVETRL